VEGVTSSQEAS